MTRSLNNCGKASLDEYESACISVDCGTHIEFYPVWRRNYARELQIMQDTVDKI